MYSLGSFVAKKVYNHPSLEGVLSYKIPKTIAISVILLFCVFQLFISYYANNTKSNKILKNNNLNNNLDIGFYAPTPNLPNQLLYGDNYRKNKEMNGDNSATTIDPSSIINLSVPSSDLFSTLDKGSEQEKKQIKNFYQAFLKKKITKSKKSKYNKEETANTEELKFITKKLNKQFTDDKEGYWKNLKDRTILNNEKVIQKLVPQLKLKSFKEMKNHNNELISKYFSFMQHSQLYNPQTMLQQCLFNHYKSAEIGKEYDALDNPPKDKILVVEGSYNRVREEDVKGKLAIYWKLFNSKGTADNQFFSTITHFTNLSNTKLRTIFIKWKLDYPGLYPKEQVESNICLVRVLNRYTFEQPSDPTEISRNSENLMCTHEMATESTQHIHEDHHQEKVWLGSGFEIGPNQELRVNSYSHSFERVSNRDKGKYPDHNGLSDGFGKITGEVLFLTEEGMKFCYDKFLKESSHNLPSKKLPMNDFIKPTAVLRSPIRPRNYVVTAFPNYAPFSSYRNNLKTPIQLFGCFIHLHSLSNDQPLYTELHYYKNGKLIQNLPLINFNPEKSTFTLKHMLRLPDELKVLQPNDEISVRAMILSLSNAQVIEFNAFILSSDNLISSDEVQMFEDIDLSGDGVPDYIDFNVNRNEIRAERSAGREHQNQALYDVAIPLFDYAETTTKYNPTKRVGGTVARLLRKDESLCVEISLYEHMNMKLCDESLLPVPLNKRLHAYGVIGNNGKYLSRIRIDPQSSKIYVAVSNNKRLLREEFIGDVLPSNNGDIISFSEKVYGRNFNVIVIHYQGESNLKAPHFLFFTTNGELINTNPFLHLRQLHWKSITRN
ncbi:hypothetical protein ABK040_008170 [Willaertia magna]